MGKIARSFLNDRERMAWEFFNACDAMAVGDATEVSQGLESLGVPSEVIGEISDHAETIRDLLQDILYPNGDANPAVAQVHDRVSKMRK